MPFSFWEYNHYVKEKSCIVIGGGIVGLSTAIELKSQDKELEVTVIDTFYPAQGASTKNAGFACFGSLTEIIDDLTIMPYEDVIEIIRMRWDGIKILRDRLHNQGVEITNHGGKELFSKSAIISDTDIEYANQLMHKAIGLENYFVRGANTHFGQLNQECILMPHEGELNPMEMYTALMHLCQSLNIQFIHGRMVESIDYQSKIVNLSGKIALGYYKLFFCTNGFTQNILPEIEVQAARNQVLVTVPIKDLKWRGVYHYDKGYYYFRRIGDSILLGGARNFDPETELTSDFSENEKIINELKRFLKDDILDGKEVAITHQWSGILGIGKSKYPIMREFENNCYLAVRLGGMGVAIGSYLGREVVKLALKN
jgi:gamma-glutamylputrescine oxidase